jgi:hypothetical protein
MCAPTVNFPGLCVALASDYIVAIVAPANSLSGRFTSTSSALTIGHLCHIRAITLMGLNSSNVLGSDIDLDSELWDSSLWAGGSNSGSGIGTSKTISVRDSETLNMTIYDSEVNAKSSGECSSIRTVRQSRITIKQPYYLGPISHTKHLVLLRKCIRLFICRTDPSNAGEFDRIIAYHRMTPTDTE